VLNQTDLLRIFCVAAEAASFREAATRLAISPQGVTRAIQQLERHFGEVLFHRSTRQVRVTEFGAQLAARGRDSLQQFDALFQRAGEDADPELPTRVRITAPRSLARMRMLPALARLVLAHPSIIVDLRLAGAIADVVDEQIDIGVRLGFMRDNRFVARAVAKMAFVIVGAPASATPNCRTTWSPRTSPAAAWSRSSTTPPRPRGICSSIGRSADRYRRACGAYSTRSSRRCRTNDLTPEKKNAAQCSLDGIRGAGNRYQAFWALPSTERERA